MAAAEGTSVLLTGVVAGAASLRMPMKGDPPVGPMAKRRIGPGVPSARGKRATRVGGHESHHATFSK